MSKESAKSMKAPVIVAGLAMVLIAVILLWRNLTPDDPVSLTGAQAEVVMGEPGVVRVYLTIESSASPDILLNAASPDADRVDIVTPGGKTRLAIPAQGTPSLSSDGAFLRLTGVKDVLDEGRLIPVSLTFARSGDVAIRARVSKSADPHAQHRAMAAMSGVEITGPPPLLHLALETAANGATLVRLKVENFTFDRGSDLPEHVPGQGHAHLYLDGLKLQRMYSPEALIGALPPGEYEVRTELNTNLHMPYIDADGPISATAELVVE